MTHDEAARLICADCRAGHKPEFLEGSAAYFYHGNLFMKCAAAPIWGDAAKKL